MRKIASLNCYFVILRIYHSRLGDLFERRRKKKKKKISKKIRGLVYCMKMCETCFTNEKKKGECYSLVTKFVLHSQIEVVIFESRSSEWLRMIFLLISLLSLSHYLNSIETSLLIKLSFATSCEIPISHFNFFFLLPPCTKKYFFFSLGRK